MLDWLFAPVGLVFSPIPAPYLVRTYWLKPWQQKPRQEVFEEGFGSFWKYLLQGAFSRVWARPVRPVGCCLGSWVVAPMGLGRFRWRRFSSPSWCHAARGLCTRVLAGRADRTRHEGDSAGLVCVGLCAPPGNRVRFYSSCTWHLFFVFCLLCLCFGHMVSSTLYRFDLLW